MPFLVDMDQNPDENNNLSNFAEFPGGEGGVLNTRLLNFLIESTLKEVESRGSGLPFINIVLFTVAPCSPNARYKPYLIRLIKTLAIEGPQNVR